MDEVFVVKYKGADQTSRVHDGLAGCLSYYARAEDALKFHRFVERIESWSHTTHDYLGHRFERAEWKGVGA